MIEYIYIIYTHKAKYIYILQGKIMKGHMVPRNTESLERKQYTKYFWKI